MSAFAFPKQVFSTHGISGFLDFENEHDLLLLQTVCIEATLVFSRAANIAESGFSRRIQLRLIAIMANTFEAVLASFKQTHAAAASRAGNASNKSTFACVEDGTA
jgi:hypothetical protein